MTSRLYIQRAAALGGTLAELTAYTGRKGTPFFDGNHSLIELGMRYFDGEASQGEFKLMDPQHDFAGDAFPSAHWLLKWTENGPGSEVWLFRGRVANDEGARGVTIVDDEVEWDIQADDGNIELRGQAFAESWVRPEETDIARLVALQLYTLNGTSSTATYHRDTCNVTVNTSHLAPNTNTVTMPPKKYLPGTQPADVVKDCADTAGKQYGVVIHHTGGSHLCLLYIVNDDHTTYLSPAKISDTLADWDPDDPSAPVLEPHWERGSAIIIGMQTLLSGLVGIWGAENGTFVEYAGVEDQTDYWVDAYHDSISTTQTQAADRTAGILEGRRNSHVTNRVSVILNSDQVDLIGAGMSIQIKSATNFEDADIYFTKRIGECRFEPRMDGRYWAHLDLERPPLRVAPGRGQAGLLPPVQSEPAPGAITDVAWHFDTGVDDNVVHDNPDDANTPHYWVSKWQTGGYAKTTSTTGSMGSDLSPRTITATPGTVYTWEGNIGQAADRYASITISVSFISAAGNRLKDDGTTAGPGEGFHLSDPSYAQNGSFAIVSGSHTAPPNTAYIDIGIGYSTARADWITITHGGGGEGFVGTAAPLAASGTGSVGTSPIGALADHIHAAQDADDTSIIDAGAFLESGTVEGAIQELAARAWKQPVRVATTAAGTLASSFENGDTIDGVVLATGDRILIKNQAAGAENGIYTVNASGAPTRATDFDLASEVLGAVMMVTNGTANADKAFQMTTNAPITLESTTLTFSEFGAGVSDHGALSGLADDDHPQYLQVSEFETTGHFEVVVNGTAPPVAVTNEAEDDWLYGFVSG